MDRETDWDDDDDADADAYGPGDDDDEPVILPCPSCGAEVHEEAQQCPTCGDYIVHPTSQWHGKPLWWIVLGLLGIGAVIWVSLP